MTARRYGGPWRRRRSAALGLVLGTALVATSTLPEAPAGAAGLEVIRWVHQYGSAAVDSAEAVALDAAGRSYATGVVALVPGPRAPTSTADAYVAAVDPDGNELWNRTFGSAAIDVGHAVAVAADEHVYTAGQTFGALPGQVTPALPDAFLVKRDGSGNEVWSVQFGAPVPPALGGFDQARGVAVDPAGNVVVAGVVDGPTSPGIQCANPDAFVAKFTSAGAEMWRTIVPSDGRDEAHGVAVGADGSIYVAGFTGETQPGCAAPPHSQAFVRKYDTDGNAVWADRFTLSDPGADTAEAVGVDSAGNVYAAGTTTVGPDNQAFVRRYDAAGTPAWTNILGTSGHDRATAIAVDGSGTSVVGGAVDGALPGQGPAGGTDAFVRVHDADGQVVSTHQFGTPAADSVRGVAMGPAGRIVVAGTTAGAFPGQSPAGGDDAFVAEIGPPGQPESDLSLAGWGSADRVQVGRRVVYTLTVTNNGPSPATGVTLAGWLPEGLVVRRVTASQGTCHRRPAVGCQLGEIGPGDHAVVTVVVRATSAGQLVTWAAATALESDSDPDDNWASIATNVRRPSIWRSWW